MSERSTPDRPTREFFERDPQSIVLRNLCLRAIDVSEAVLASEGQNAEALAELLDINRQLQTLGIEPEMHVIAPDDPEREAKSRRVTSDPVVTMEWVAGQVRSVLITSSGFYDSGSPAALKEHLEPIGPEETFGLVNLRAVGPKTQRFIRGLTLINAVRGFVDYQAGPTEVE